MRRATLCGILVLLAPTAGCASFPFDLQARAMPANTPPAQAADVGPAKPPADLDSAIRDASSQRRNGDLGGAAKSLSQLVLVAPDDARVLGEYGKTLAGLGRSDDALAFLERAIQLQPDDWTLHSAQGITYDQKGNFRAAQAAYARALILKPGEPTVLNNNAMSHIQAGDLDGAEKLLREAAPFTPDFPRIAQNLALVETLKGARLSRPTTYTPPPAAPVDEIPSMATPAAEVLAVAPAETLAVTPSEPVTAEMLAAPSVISAPAEDPAVATVVPPKTPTSLATRRNADAGSRLAELQADPTIVVAPIPKAERTPRPAPVPAKAMVPGLPVAKLTEISVTPKNVQAISQPGSAYYVQAGAFSSEARAGVVASALDPMGARVTPGLSNGRAIYRVRIGPFLTREQAKAAESQAQALGQADLAIVSQ